MKIKIITCVLLTFILPVVAIAAQPPSPIDELFELSLKELQNVEVSGPTRTLKNLQRAPASVTVFRHDELQNMGIDFLFELLNYVPGFQTSRDNDYGGTYFYSSRGSDTGQDTTAILLLIDGVPRQEIRNASASALSSLMPVDRIERIEVIRGPGSALYGSGAFLGIINIVTVTGNNGIKVTAGQPDRQEVQGQVSANSGDWRFDLFVSDYRDDGDHYILDDRFRVEPTSTSDPQATQNYAFRLGFRDTLITFEHDNIESEDYYSISAINNDLNEMRHFLNFGAIEQGMQWGELSSTLRLSYSENELGYKAQGSLPGALSSISNPSSAEPLIGDTFYQVNSWMLQWLNDWSLSDTDSVQFGLERQREEMETARVLANFDVEMLANGVRPVTYSADGDLYYEVVRTDSRAITGVYAQWQHRFDTGTDLTLGARYDDYEDFDSQLSGRLALVHQLNHHHYLKLLYGEAFRAPSLNQINVKETLTVAPNPDLEAESIQATELVWLMRTEAMSFSASAFYNVIDNQINSSGFVGGKRANENVEQDNSSGLELEATLQIGLNWRLRAGLTDFFTLPESSSRESCHLASLIINYQHEKWWANLSGYYNSQRDMPLASDGVIDGFTIVNAKLGYLFSESLRVHLQVKNLLNEVAASSPQSTAISTPVPYRGREASAGVTFTFM